MAWPLSDAVLLCVARRSRDAARSAPVPAAALAVAFLAGPVVLFLATSEAARAVKPALADPTATRMLVGGLVLPALAAGAALARLVPGPLALGLQVAAAPIVPPLLAWAAAAPTVLAGVAFLPLAVAVVGPFAFASPGGTWAAAVVAAALVLAAAVGAAATRVVTLAWRGSRRAVAGAAVAVAGSALAVVVGLDPITRSARVLADGTGGPFAILTLAGAAVFWILAAVAAGRPRDRRIGTRARGRLRAPIGRAPIVALGVATLLRRSDTRGTLVAAVLFGATSLAASVPTGLEPTASVLLGVSAALAAAVLAPLAVGGIVGDLRWLLATSPRSRWSMALGWVTAGAIAVSVAIVPLLALAAGAARLPPATLGTLALGAALAVGCGLAAGSVAPWRATGASGQLGALIVLATFASAAGAVSIGTARLAERFDLHPGLATAASAVLPVGIALSLIARRLERSPC